MSGNESAFPVTPPCDVSGVIPGGFYQPEPGLTKREYFAGLAMQGLMAAAAQQRHIPTVVQDSVNLADALLAELEKAK